MIMGEQRREARDMVKVAMKGMVLLGGGRFLMGSTDVLAVFARCQRCHRP